jgi:hypothetical protein
MRLAGLAVVALLALNGPAAALPVDLELVLAVDVSRSVDPEEAKLQREGYLEALVHPRVLQAIRSGPLGKIAVTYVEWAGVDTQYTVVPWTVIEDDQSAAGFTSRIAAAPYNARNWTSVSGAIDYAVRLFEDNGFEGTRRVIDVSGDGRTNQGRPSSAARDDAVAAGITINGLPVVNERMNFYRPPEYDLDVYYRDNVIGGPGAFMIVAENFNAFTGAILSKLIREIASVPGDTTVAESR